MSQPSATSNQSSNGQSSTATLVMQLQTALVAIDYLQAQVMQMKGMFDDEDGMIRGALQNSDRAASSSHELLAQLNRTELA